MSLRSKLLEIYNGILIIPQPPTEQARREAEQLRMEQIANTIRDGIAACKDIEDTHNSLDDCTQFYHWYGNTIQGQASWYSLLLALKNKSTEIINNL